MNNNGSQRPNRPTVRNCGKPIEVWRWLVLTAVLTALVKLGLTNVPVFAFLDDLGWILLGLTVATIIYMLDILVLWSCKSRLWYQDHPIKGWPVYPKQSQGWLNWFFILVILILLLFVIGGNTDDGNKEMSLMDRVSSFFSFSNDKDKEIISNMSSSFGGSSTDQASETDLAILCKQTGYNTPECKTADGYTVYWQDLASISELSHLTFTVENPGQKCWDCGNVLTGSNRTPVGCNPLLATLRGKHPSTGLWQESRSCLVPPATSDPTTTAP